MYVSGDDSASNTVSISSASAYKLGLTKGVVISHDVVV